MRLCVQCRHCIVPPPPQPPLWPEPGAPDLVRQKRRKWFWLSQSPDYQPPPPPPPSPTYDLERDAVCARVLSPVTGQPYMPCGARRHMVGDPCGSGGNEFEPRTA